MEGEDKIGKNTFRETAWEISVSPDRHQIIKKVDFDISLISKKGGL